MAQRTQNGYSHISIHVQNANTPWIFQERKMTSTVNSCKEDQISLCFDVHSTHAYQAISSLTHHISDTRPTANCSTATQKHASQGEHIARHVYRAKQITLQQVIIQQRRRRQRTVIPTSKMSGLLSRIDRAKPADSSVESAASVGCVRMIYSLV